jgi:PAS domain S-box-containing protein
MPGRLHPLLTPEVQRWLGERPLTPELQGLLEGLSVRLEVVDDVRAADPAGELEAFFRLSGDLLMVLDSSLCIRHLNTAFLALGWGVAECRGKSVMELVASADRATTLATLKSMLATHEQVPLEARMLDARGELRVVHWLLTTDDQGQRIFGVGRDVSERQDLERRLSQADRLEAVGRLAAGVAHEMNTPLQFLGDNVTFVSDACTELLEALSPTGRPADVAYLREELPRALAALSEGLGRVSRLVRSLKELAPSDGEAVEPTELVDLVPTLRATLGALAGTTLEGLQVVSELGELPPVRCDVASIARVLTSLLSNAAHAVAAAARPGEVRVRAFVEGDEAVVSVRDDGVGIPDQVRPRIFEPFFTTRDVGQGSGQSLAVARSIVERHHGSIGFETQLGVGTTFTVRLPLADAVTEADLWG